jgi:small subunit ribosomal protein S20
LSINSGLLLGLLPVYFILIKEDILAHHKSAKKRIITSEKRNLYNRSIKSRVKTFSHHFEDAVNSENREESQKTFATAVSEIQKAVSKGVLHKNTAARKVSRLARQFNRTFAAKAEQN